MAKALASRRVGAASTRKDGTVPSKGTYAHLALKRASDASGTENAMPPPSKIPTSKKEKQKPLKAKVVGSGKGKG